MMTGKAPLQDRCVLLSHAFLCQHNALRFLFAGIALILLAQVVSADPLGDYHKRIRQAITALDSLTQSDENESVETYTARDTQTVASVRTLLPESESLHWSDTGFSVDNSWLHQELNKYEADKTTGRYDQLRRITERLKAIDDRLAEIEKPGSGTIGNKSDQSRKLTEILRRPEYARKVEQKNALSRLIERIVKWIQSWLPKPAPVSSGSASVISKTAQVFVIALAVGVLLFVLKLFLPRLLRSKKPKKKKKDKARIVLGEHLEPDQSALDLLSEAETLARRGELRAAIRKAYIALLVELGDRKVISLAQHKTNRDYLSAVRQVEPLYGNVKQLTDSFERHWYGLVQATESDWLAFRSAYRQALR
jgi:hypothetical protein